MLCSCVICESIGSSVAAFAQTTSSLKVEYYMRSGRTNLALREWDRAMADFHQCLLLAPDNLDAYSGLAGACFLKGDLHQAVTAYDHIIECDPQDPIAHLNRGNIYRLEKNYGKAIADFNECLKLDPKNRDAYGGRGSAFFRTGAYSNAINDFTLVLESGTNDPSALISREDRADCYYETKQYERADEDFKIVAGIETGNYNVYNDIAWFRATCPVAAMRDGSNAVELATKACELSQWRDPKVIDTLAAAFAEEGNFQKAITYQEDALEISGVAGKEIQGAKDRLNLYLAKEPYRVRGVSH